MAFIQNNMMRSRMLKGTGAQVFAQLTHIVIRIIEIPLFLQIFGAQLYGEWLILYAIPSYLSFGGLGFIAAGSHEMVMLIAKNKINEAVEVFQSIGILSGLLSILIAVLMGGIVVLAPLEQWFHFTLTDEGTVRTVIYILVISLLLNIQAHLAYSGFYSQGLYGEGLNYLTWVRIIAFLFLVAFTIYFSTLLASALGLLIGRLVGTIVIVTIVRRRVPWIRYGVSRASMESMRRLWPPALASAAFPIGNLLNIQGFRLLVGAIFGPVSVVLFSMLRTLTRFVSQIISSINKIAKPELGIAYGEKDKELFRKIYRRSSQVSIWAGTLISAALIALGPEIVAIWTAGRIDFEPSLFFWLIIAGLVNSTWQTALMVTIATNRHLKEAITFLIVNSSAIVIAYWGATIAGFVGVGMVLTAVEMSMAWFVLRRSHRLAGDTWSNWMAYVIRPPLFLLRLPVDILRARGWFRRDH